MYNPQGLTVDQYKYYRAIDINDAGLWREHRYVNGKLIYSDSGVGNAPLWTDEQDCYEMQSGYADDVETVYVYVESYGYAWNERKPYLNLYQGLDAFDYKCYWANV